MKKIVIAVALLATLTLSASARMLVAPNPIVIRVATSDRVVIGKVSEIADKTVPADLFKGDTRQLKVATVTVEEAIVGKKAKTIKVGFVAPPMPVVGGGFRPILRGSVEVTLTVGQEAMLFLTKHPTNKDLYIMPAYFDVVNKTGNLNFGADRDEAKRGVKLLANAKKGIVSKDAKERLETVGMLMARYRLAPAGSTKTETVPAGQSKKILTALAETDWKNFAPQNFMFNPQGLFFRLGLTPKDGWTQPKDFTQFELEAKKWLKDNAGTYKMQRYVRASDEKSGPEPEPE